MAGISKKLINNPSNSADSYSSHEIRVAGAAAGDPWYQVTVNNQRAYAWGIDNNDEDQFKITTIGGNSLDPSSGNEVFTITSTGEIIKPLNPLLVALVSMVQNNVTGAGTQYNLICDSVASQAGNNYNSTTGVYTIPSDGLWNVLIRVKVSEISAAMTTGGIGIQLNGSGFSNINTDNPATVRNAGNTADFIYTNLFEFSAADTVQPAIKLSSGAGDTADVGAASSFTIWRVQ